MRYSVCLLIWHFPSHHSDNSTQTRWTRIAKQRYESCDMSKDPKPTGLIYNGEITIPVQGYFDADYESENWFLDTYSPLPSLPFLGKQRTNNGCAIQSQIRGAMALAAKEIWLQYLLQDLGMSKYMPTVLCCGNQDAISLAKNSTHHVKTNHVDVQLTSSEIFLKRGLE